MINDVSEGADENSIKNYFQEGKHTEVGLLNHMASKDSNLL